MIHLLVELAADYGPAITLVVTVSRVVALTRITYAALRRHRKLLSRGKGKHRATPKNTVLSTPAANPRAAGQ